jgi:hypothetical protein
MLTRKDKEWIQKAIREEFKAALFREITVRKAAKTPGEVDGKIETSTQNLLDQLVLDLPVWVQSLGLMEGEVTKNTDAVNGFVGLMGSLQESFLTIAKFTIALQEMGVMDVIAEELKPIEITDETDTG